MFIHNNIIYLYIFAFAIKEKYLRMVYNKQKLVVENKK